MSTNGTTLLGCVKLPHLHNLKRLRSIVTGCQKFRIENDELFTRFVYKRRAKGEEVDRRWFKKTMQQIMNENQPPGWRNFRYSNGWLQVFLKKYRISWQAQTEKKHLSNALRVPLLQAFHRDLCLLQQSDGINPRDEEYGRFPPGAIWNVDQIPFSFVRCHRHSYNSKGEPCWVKTQGQSGNDKRMATIVLTLRADGVQHVRPFILFRGAGELPQAYRDEMDAEGIPYGFNSKAWADGPSCLDYLNYFSRETKTHCPEFKEHLLLLDNLS